MISIVKVGVEDFVWWEKEESGPEQSADEEGDLTMEIKDTFRLSELEDKVVEDAVN